MTSHALFLAPEAFYPRFGGGALRSASVFEYLLRTHVVDVIAFWPGAVPGAREVLTIDLPVHSKSPVARGARNLRRYAVGRPPLVDRFSGFDAQIAGWLSGRQYDVAVVEHFWCAPYARVLRPRARRLVLDLHNVESRLNARLADAEPWPQSAMFRGFATEYERLEREWLPQYDDVLVTSGADAFKLPAERVTVYPNTIPLQEEPEVAPEHAIVFTGNLEYEPNLLAVRWFAREVWPLIRREEPALEWRLVGRNAQAIEASLQGVEGVRVLGAVEDAVVEIARTRAAVVPLLAGSGTRFKILEAWAAARPVVATTIGAEGLGGVNGQHLVIADGAEAFAAAVVRVVRAPGALGRDGRALYLERYTTDAGWRVLEAIGI